MLPNKAILGWINCLEQTSWNLYDLILHVRKMSVLKQSLGKVPTLGSVTLGCLCWPSPDLDRAAWLSMHCSAFCHPFPGIMSGITNRSKASSHFPPPPSPPQLLKWGVEREVWCCILLVLWELIPRPKVFGDTSPPVVIACPSRGAAISASTSQEAASNAPQSKTTLV